MSPRTPPSTDPAGTERVSGWTIEVPTTPGYYWIRRQNPPELDIVELQHGEGCRPRWAIMDWDGGWDPDWTPGVEFLPIRRPT